MFVLYLKVLADKLRKWHHDIQVLWTLCNILMIFHLRDMYRYHNTHKHNRYRTQIHETGNKSHLLYSAHCFQLDVFTELFSTQNKAAFASVQTDSEEDQILPERKRALILTIPGSCLSQLCDITWRILFFFHLTCF